MGASEEVALTADKPPSWSESWRITMGVKALRRIYMALPLTAGVAIAIANLRSLYFFEVWGLTPAQRGIIATINDPFAVAGIIVGGLVGNRFLRYRPSRLLLYQGAMGIFNAATLGFIVLI